MEDSSIVSISSNKTFEDITVFAILLAVLTHFSKLDADDIVRNIADLEVCELLKAKQVTRLVKKYQKTWSTKKTQIFTLILDIRDAVPAGKLSEALINLGLLQIADSIQTTLSRRNKHCFSITFPHAAFIRKIYYNYKSWCDDNVFRCRRISLRQAFNGFLSRVQSAASVRSHDKWADALTIIMSLLIQQHIEHAEIKELIEEFTDHWPANVNRTMPMILRQCKLAIIAARNAEWVEAEVRISNAIYLHQPYNDFAIRYMVLHAHVYVRQLKQKECNNVEHKQQAIEVCKRSLDVFASDVVDDFSTLVYRSFCLYMVTILLGILPYFEIDIHMVIPHDDIRRAEQLLTDVERNFNTAVLVEDRRKMMFYILKARLHQLQENYFSAMENVRSAKHLMDIGTTYEDEKRNLESFKNQLKLKYDAKCGLSSNRD